MNEPDYFEKRYTRAYIAYHLIIGAVIFTASLIIYRAALALFNFFAVVA